ncbi:hypothetical protein Tco_0192017, partial [Tanacetum coccineum]
MKREGKGFSSRVTPLFQTMMVQAPEEVGKGRKLRKDIEIPETSGPTESMADEAANEEHVPLHSNDPPLSGEDRLKLNELMEIYTNLQQKILDLETSKAAQAQEISSLKQRVEQLEKKKKSRPHGLRRLYKGRKIADIDQDADISLIDETQWRNGEDMFDVNADLQGEEVVAEKEVASTADPITIAGEVVTTV